MFFLATKCVFFCLYSFSTSLCRNDDHADAELMMKGLWGVSGNSGAEVSAGGLAKLDKSC